MLQVPLPEPVLRVRRAQLPEQVRVPVQEQWVLQRPEPVQQAQVQLQAADTAVHIRGS